jgi:hypothetical protein
MTPQPLQSLTMTDGDFFSQLAHDILTSWHMTNDQFCSTLKTNSDQSHQLIDYLINQVGNWLTYSLPPMCDRIHA